MKKLNLFGWTLFILFFATASCKKVDPVIPPVLPAVEKNLIDKAFPSSNFNVDVTSGSDAYYEMGFKFSVNRPGKITRIGVKTPDIGTYRVTLWDADTKSPIATASCNHQNSTVYTTVAIGQTPLIVGKNYYITFRTVNQNRYSIMPKTSGTHITYPIALGSISISQYGYYFAWTVSDNGDVPKFPDIFPTLFARGFPEFEFQPD